EVEGQGFENWGGHASDKVFTPGSEGIRIVLHRLARAKFLVVDAASGAPIERFAIGASAAPPENQDPGLPDMRLRTEEHPGGAAELDAEAGKHAVFVEAPGYMRLQA